ncbi:hypothetical protein WDV06_31885 [Streptomyces racemochromogenes]|uniref:Uncharacterized protein n=1 Tax=Streptomyces racemochromogenes TaxID=67353 RepID=A0ABW7PMM5_9ACTN
MAAVGEPDVVWSLPGADAAAGWRALLWTVRVEGGIAVLLAQERFLRRDYGVWHARERFDAEVVFVSGEGAVQRRVPLRGVEPGAAHFAVLPGDRFLLVRGRSHEGAEGRWEPNAVVHGADGATVERAFCVGDDIPALVTDRRGGIWAAYGDEGIYGNHPQTAAGLAGWSGRGRHTWGPDGRLPAWPLEGLAAATEREAVWLAWYSGGGEGTHLSRVTPATGEVATFRSPAHGIDGIAVCGDRAVVSRRDHGKHSTTLIRAGLGADGVWTVGGEERLRMPGPVRMRCGQGRDGVLWLRAGDAWVRVRA